jgi:hypothetical protein
MTQSEFRPGDRILYLNESNEEHSFVDVGEIAETHEPCISSYGDQIPLRHSVWPSDPDEALYVVQENSILDVL